jgi:hypothetical protein
MGVEDKDNSEDFFSLIEKEQKIEDPFAEDEILFRNEKGELKVLKGGQVLDFKQREEEPAAISSIPPPVVKVKAPPPAAKPLEIDKEVNNIIKKSGLKFSDPNESKRFKNIITLRLKEVRDQVQTRETLLSSPLVGGTGLDAQTADRVLALINQEIEQLNGKLRDKVSSEPFSDLHAEAQKILAEPSAEEKPRVTFKPKTPSTPLPTEAKPPAPRPKPSAEMPPRPIAPVRPVVRPTETKPKIEDVKFEPKLTGPIEEIRSMTLTDFRRLASSPDQIIEKIIEKIELLEEESFSKKTQAIKAWKESEVYRLYLDLGDQSMEERKPISEVIAQRQQANQPVLTEQEIEAIIELNQKLRF